MKVDGLVLSTTEMLEPALGRMVSKKKTKTRNKEVPLKSNQQKMSKQRVIYTYMSSNRRWLPFPRQVHKTVYCSRCSRHRVNQVEPSCSSLANPGRGWSKPTNLGVRGDDDRFWQEFAKTGQNWPQTAKVSPEGFERYRQGIGRAGRQTQGLAIVYQWMSSNSISNKLTSSKMRKLKSWQANWRTARLSRQKGFCWKLLWLPFDCHFLADLNHSVIVENLTLQRMLYDVKQNV